MPIRRLTLLLLASALILGVLSYSTTLSALLFSLGLLTTFLLLYLSRFFSNPKEAQALFTPTASDSFSDCAVTDPNGQQLISFHTYKKATRLLYQSLTILLLLLIITSIGLRTLPVPTALLVPIASLLFLLLLTISLYRFYSITPPHHRLSTLKALFTADKGRLFAKHASTKDSGEVTVAYSTYKRLYKITGITLTALTILLLIATFSEVRATRLNTEHALNATGNQLSHVWQVVRGTKEGDITEEVKRLLAQSVQVAPTLDESSLTRRILTEVTDNLPEPTTVTSTNTVVEKNIIHSHTLETIKFEDNGYLSYQDETGTTFLTFGGSPKMTLEEAGILNIKGEWQIDGTKVEATASHLNNIDDLKDSPLLVIEADSDLNKERVLTAGTGITLSDGGENNNATISLDLNGVTYTWPSADGTASQYLQTNGSNTLSWADVASGITIGDTVTNATQGSVLFAGASSVLAQDNTNLFWDDSANRLGVGTTSPGAKLEVDGGDLILTGAATNHLVVPSNNDAATPTLAFGDANTGFFEPSDNNLSVAIAGYQRWAWAAGVFYANSGGGAQLVDGTASTTTPTLVPNRSSSNTGIGGTAGTISLITGGTEAVRIDNSQDVSITGALQIDGNTTLGSDGSDSITINADALTYASDTAVTLSGGVDGLNFDSNTLSIDAENNRVGIGTAGPGSTLHVSRNQSDIAADNPLVLLETTGAAANTKGAILHLTTTRGTGVDDTDLFKVAGPSVTYFAIRNTGALYVKSTTTDNAARFRLDVSSTVFNDTKSAVYMSNENTTANNWVKFSFGGKAGTISAASVAAEISDHTNSYADLTFWTRGTGGWSEKVRIEDNGNVGIGTTAPGAALEINTATASADGLILQTTDDSATKDILQVQDSAGTAYIKIDGDTPQVLEFVNTGSSVFIGENAGDSDDLSANRNVFIGYDAGTANTSGDYNVAIGYHALDANVTHANSVAVGYLALTNATANSNVAVGHSALENTTTGNTNVAVGPQAGLFNETGSANVTLGYRAGRGASGQSYSSDIFIGANAGYSITTGIQNVAIGVSALYDITSGNENIAIGQLTLSENQTGTRNVAIGRQAGDGTDGVSVTSNTLIGHDAGFTIAGDNNTAIGDSALKLNSTGDNNIALGYQAANNLTTGSNNIIIGYDIDAPSATGSNQMSIGNLIFATGVDGTGTTISSGNVGIGTTAPNEKLSIDGGNLSLGDVSAGTSSDNVLVIANGTIPGSSPADAIQLYAEDVSSSSELKVRDEAGNITTLSPHQFSLFNPQDSDYGGIDIPWSFYSKNEDKGQEINVDMLGLAQAVELLSGEQYVYARDLHSGDMITPPSVIDQLSDPASVDAPNHQPNFASTPQIGKTRLVSSTESGWWEITDQDYPNIKVGDMVVGRIDKQLEDGALHGLWETIDISSLFSRLDALEKITAGTYAPPKKGELEGVLGRVGDSITDYYLPLTTYSLQSLEIQNNANILGDLVVEGDASIEGSLERSNEQIGRATIPQGGTEVEVEFKEPFADVPVVQTNVNRDLESYWTTNESKTGFTIRVREPVSSDTTFTWTALLTTDIQTTTGTAPKSQPKQEPEQETSTEQDSNTDTPTDDKPAKKDKPKPTPTPTPSLSPMPSPTPTPQVAGTTDDATGSSDEPTDTESAETDDTTDELIEQ